MGSEIKITTEELWNEARTLSAIATDIGRISGKNSAAINKMEESCSFMTVAGIYVSANRLISSFSTLMQNLSHVATKAMNCATAYEEANEDLKKEFSDWFDSVEVNTIGGSTEAYSQYLQSLEEQRIANEVRERYRNSQRINTSGYPISTYYSYYDINGIYRQNWGLYEKSGGCTWFAFNRWKEVNGTELEFHGAGGGNATNWDERISREHFDVLDLTSNSDPSVISRNTIANIEGDPGHVVYVEGVIDGMVYYSEGNSRNPSNPGIIQEVTIQEFLSKFDHLIVPK